MKEHVLIDRAALEKEIETSGTKFAVQKLFYDLDMCGVQTFLLPPRARLSEIKEALDQFEIESKGVTVRFSYAKALNLPRGFFCNRERCLNFILEQNRDYSIIIQEYTKLENSFELYMDSNILYLQVMPGIWEISTSDGPDIIKEEKGKLTIWRYSKMRSAKLADEEGAFYREGRVPFDFDTLLRFHSHLQEYRDRLDLLRQSFSPLCCHFYIDSQNRFSFLNVRDFGSFPINEDSPTHFYIVNSPTDIDQWDGKKPILFNVRAERENDTPLVSTIRYLAKRGINKVYVNYGILSHPAILLREAGIQVQQSYMLYEKQTAFTQNKELEATEALNIASLEQESQIVTGVANEGNQVMEQELHSLYLSRP